MKKKNNLIVLVLTVMMGLTLIQLATHQVSNTLTLAEFQKVVETYEVKEAIVTPKNTIVDIEGVYIKEERSIGFSTRVINNDDQVKEILDSFRDKGVEWDTADPNQGNFFVDLLMLFVPYLILGGIMFFIFSKMGAGGNKQAFDFGKSTAKVQGDTKVRFDDVAGAEE